MSETRLKNARATLPEGYQFGDAASLRDAEPRLVATVEGARLTVGDTIYIKLGK